MDRLIRSKIFAGNIQQFRAAMQRLHDHLAQEGWLSGDGQRLVFGEYPYMRGIYHVPIAQDDLDGAFSAFDWSSGCDEITDKTSARRPATRASWQVLLWRKSSMRAEYHPTKGMFTAGIEAYEEGDRRTRVSFLDGYDPETPLRRRLEIGQVFAEFCDWVIEEIWQMPAREAEDSADESELVSLRRQLADARSNLQLIQERKSQYVMGVDIPLQLVKDEQLLSERIVELEQRVAELG